MEEKSFQYFVDDLRQWHKPEARKLPWKGVKDPYLVWVSEIFLQQTQADRVVEFYLRFTAKFPTVGFLAKSSFENALPYFKGLGYYRRLRSMIETAKIVTKDHGGKFPRTVEKLQQLPGIGEYTARAIASFAFGQKVIAPDTNVKRVIIRYFSTRDPPAPLKGGVRFPLVRGLGGLRGWSWYDDHYPKHFNVNQALMDLGAQVCKAKDPKCSECPLKKKCQFARNTSDHPAPLKGGVRFPLVRGLGGLRNFQKIVVGILIQDKRVLVSRRKADQTYSGLLEFPGGKVEAGEDERRAMQREFREEVGVEVSVRPRFRKIVQQKKKQVLSFHRCRVLTGQPRSLEGQEVFWIDQDQLESSQFIPVNKGVIQELKKSRL